MNNLRQLSALGTVSYISGIQYLPEKFCYSYGQMVNYNTTHLESEGKYVYYDRMMSSWLPRARNDLVKQMRGDWLFMIDTDFEFEPDVLVRMLKIMDKYQAPVLTGLYTYKKKPYFPVIYSHNDERAVYEGIISWPEDCEIFQIDAAGAGCLLIKKFVFDLIWKKLNQDPFDIMEKNSEDMSFFNRLRKVGVGVYCTPQINFSHLSVEGINFNRNTFTKDMLKTPYIR